MPIYEFYCPACHTILNFLARTALADRRPACPHCGRQNLERQVSRFAAIGRAKPRDEAAAAPGASPDDARLERAMTELAGRAESMDENDPRAAARLMREMSGLTGMKLGPHMQEALKRLESGEDPEKIEADMGDLLNEDDAAEAPAGDEAAQAAARRRPPRRDPTLYDL